ncbi:hypothetical protein B0H12DRAFT_1241683 [Mycena haematopus]|nr:hypothetical protein B0H12DRAFT_1241683 [Mycena haematopus]
MRLRKSEVPEVGILLLLLSKLELLDRKFHQLSSWPTLLLRLYLLFLPPVRLPKSLHLPVQVEVKEEMECRQYPLVMVSQQEILVLEDQNNPVAEDPEVLLDLEEVDHLFL